MNIDEKKEKVGVKMESKFKGLDFKTVKRWNCVFEKDKMKLDMRIREDRGYHNLHGYSCIHLMRKVCGVRWGIGFAPELFNYFHISRLSNEISSDYLQIVMITLCLINPSSKVSECLGNFHLNIRFKYLFYNLIIIFNLFIKGLL